MTIRRLLFWLLIAAFIWLVASRIGEIQGLAYTLSQGNLAWILAAIAMQIAYYVAYSAIYWSAFCTVDVHTRFRDLPALVFSSTFVNVVAPAGGTAGAALFVDYATRRKQSLVRAAAGTLLQLIAYLASFLLVLFAGMAYLFLQGNLQLYEILAALFLLAAVTGQTAVLLLGLCRPTVLRRIVHGLHRGLDWLRHRLKLAPSLAADWGERHSTEFIQAAQAIAAHPRLLLRTMLIALAAHLLDIASIFTLFLAFGYMSGPGVLASGYSMAVLFSIVSFTPQGIGVVEGLMTLVFVSLDVPVEVATLVTLSFRGLTFWLPLGLGFLLLRRTGNFH